MIVPRIKGEPATVKKNLIPCAKVHGDRIGGDADVTKIPCAVPRRNVHAPGKGHGEMGEIPANAAPFLMCLRSRAIPPCMMVSEFDASVRVVTYRLRTPPAASNATKERPRQVREFFSIAIPTCEQEGHRAAGQRASFPLLGRRTSLIRQAAVLYQELAPDLKQAGWRDKPGANV